MKKFFAALLFLGYFISCVPEKYRDFSQTPTGLHYRLLALGDGDLPQKDEVITARLLIFSRDRDTVFFNEEPITFTYLALPYADEFISMLKQGDSAEFILNSGRFRNNSTGIDLHIPPDNVELLLRIRIERIRSQHDYALEQIWAEEDPEMQEQQLLKLFLKENGLEPSDFFKNGIYFLPIADGLPGDSVQRGSLVTCRYTGTHTDGKIFDSTYGNAQPLEITYGKPGQLIKGLEIALKGMKKGEKAKIIIPSQLAFGAEGFADIVPPYATVIYDLEVTDIKNNP